MSVRLTVRVAPGAARSGIVGPYAGGWKVRVAAAAESGKANDALVGLLSEALAVPERAIRILVGHAARTKIVEVEGLDPDAVAARLAAAEREV